MYRRSIKPKASVQAFDPLCEVQSDKASVEITSPYDGVVKEILVNEGEVAKVGAGLCLIEVDEELVDGVEEEASRPPQKVEEPAEPPTRRRHPLDPSFSKTDKHAESDNVLATPSVRHLARTKGVDLAKLVPGSGKSGRIEKMDVEAHLSGGAGATSQHVDLSQDAVIALGRTRYGMWKAMVKVGVLCVFSVCFSDRVLESGNTPFWVCALLSHSLHGTHDFP